VPLSQCYYLATLCVSAVFAVAWRPSVCLSVCGVGGLYPDGEDAVKVLSRSNSPITVVVWPERRYPIPRGSVQQGRKIHGGDKIFAIFDWNRRSFRKRYDTGPSLLRNVNRKSQPWIDPCRFRWPWVTPNPGFKVDAYYKSNISKEQSYCRTLIGNHTIYPMITFNDLYLPLTGISRSRYFSTTNISETTRYRAIITIERQ